MDEAKAFLEMVVTLLVPCDSSFVCQTRDHTKLDNTEENEKVFHNTLERKLFASERKFTDSLHFKFQEYNFLIFVTPTQCTIPKIHFPEIQLRRSNDSETQLATDNTALHSFVVDSGPRRHYSLTSNFSPKT